jgi:hypothetical protein
MKPTAKPFWQAASPNPSAICVLPVPFESGTYCPVPGAGRDNLLPLSSALRLPVAIVRRHPFRGVTMLVIEQPDGTMALVPEWMTEQAAAAVEIREAPRFPLAELRALRQVADAVLSLLSDRGNGDRHGILRTPSSAGAVRERGSEDVTTAGVIERLLLLVRQLLVETAVAELAVTERIDEQQDHA